MFSKKKKKLDISLPKNFEHRVHTGFDKRENRYVGLPPQWAGIVSPTPSAKGIVGFSQRPTPLIDPSEITPTEILDLKVVTVCTPQPSVHSKLILITNYCILSGLTESPWGESWKLFKFLQNDKRFFCSSDFCKSNLLIVIDNRKPCRCKQLSEAKAKQRKMTAATEESAVEEEDRVYLGRRA